VVEDVHWNTRIRGGIHRSKEYKKAAAAFESESTFLRQQGVIVNDKTREWKVVNYNYEECCWFRSFLPTLCEYWCTRDAPRDRNPKGWWNRELPSIGSGPRCRAHAAAPALSRPAGRGRQGHARRPVGRAGGREGAGGKSEKDAKLAQKLGQLQPSVTVSPQECMGQLASFGPT
jgi:hypothetical protein